MDTDSSTWGDEVEYLVLRLKHEAREVHLSLRGSQILSDLKRRFPEELFDLEACKYMLESQPRRPYGDSLSDLAIVESDIRERQVNTDPRWLLMLIVKFTGDGKLLLAYRTTNEQSL